MKFEKAFCPSCGAPIIFPEGKNVCFCSHCGHQIFMTDEQLSLKLKYRSREDIMEFLGGIAILIFDIVIAIVIGLVIIFGH